MFSRISFLLLFLGQAAPIGVPWRLGRSQESTGSIPCRSPIYKTPLFLPKARSQW